MGEASNVNSMCLRSLAVSSLLVVACARDNPLFGLGDDGTAGAAGTTSGVDMGSGATVGDGDGSTTGSDGAGGGTEGADKGDGDDDDDTGDDDDDDTDDDDDDDTDGDTEGDATDTGKADCQYILEAPPLEDTFVVAQEGPTCGAAGMPCGENNYGAVPQHVIEDGDGYRAFMLLRFAQPVDDGDTVIEASLLLHADGPDTSEALLVRELGGEPWGAGAGNNTEADEGEASWLWRARPEPWSSPDRDEGDFSVMLDENGPIGSADHVFDGPQWVPIELDLRSAQQWDDGEVWLAITAEPGEVVASALESGDAPVLALEVDECR